MQIGITDYQFQQPEKGQFGMRQAAPRNDLRLRKKGLI
jgi:hypothetical protein